MNTEFNYKFGKLIPVLRCVYCNYALHQEEYLQLITTLIECPNCKQDLVANFQEDNLIEINGVLYHRTDL